MRKLMRALKVIFADFPKPLKWILLWGFFLGLFSWLILNFIDKGKIIITQGFWFVLYIFMGLFILGFLYSAIKYVYQSFDKSNPSKSPIRKKRLPDEIFIKKEFEKNYFWTLSIKRCFTPLDTPGQDKFIKASIIKGPFCMDCHLPPQRIYKRIVGGVLDIYVCTTPDCKIGVGKSTTTASEYAQFNDSVERKINSFMIKNFDDVWKIYVKEYDRLTNKKYDDYELPLYI